MSNQIFKVGDKVFIKGSRWVKDGEYAVKQTTPGSKMPISVMSESGDTLWIESEHIFPVQPPSFESEISRLIEAYPDKAEELKKMLPEVKPLVPSGWILKHPNGKTVLIGTTQPELIQDHILLGNAFAFDFEIVTNGGFNYLKVTPK